ncbi:hypothetical protein BDV19DRAFT_389399 [Aspergillus venezuelensis]
MASTSSKSTESPVPPRMDVDAHHRAWSDWARRAPGQKLTADKENLSVVIGKAVGEAVKAAIIPPQHARKAHELMLVTGHCESNMNPEASNPHSSAIGFFQQTIQFHTRSRMNPQSVRDKPLTKEQRKDVATAAGFFIRQLAVTENWHEKRFEDAAYEVQKFRKQDKHRYADPEIIREVVCVSGALFPEAASMAENAVYSDEERAQLRCPNPRRFFCGAGAACDASDPPEEPSIRDEDIRPPMPDIHFDTSPTPPIDLTPKDPMPREAREKWDHATRTGSTGLLTAIFGMGAGSAMGAATAGGVTVVPAGTGLALSMNLLHPAGQVGALIGLGVAGSCMAYQYFTQGSSDASHPRDDGDDTGSDTGGDSDDSGDSEEEHDESGTDDSGAENSD